LIKNFRSLLEEAFFAFFADKAPLLGAALAYFGVFSLAPLLFIAIAVAGLFFGHDAAAGRLYDGLRGAFGEEGAKVLQGMIAAAGRGGGDWLANLIASLFVLMGATGCFLQLKEALDSIWKAKSRPKGLKEQLLVQLYTLPLLLGTGLFVVLAMILSALLTAFGTLLNSFALLWHLLNFAFSLAIGTLLVAALFRFVPEARLPWKALWPGAFLTALLFTLGKSLFGWFLGRTDLVSPYGGASSLVGLLLWIDYSAQVLLFGAEFVKAQKKEAARASFRKEPEN
jgi:membrane protein